MCPRENQEKEKYDKLFFIFTELLKLCLFSFKGEPGKPGEQGLMASINLSFSVIKLMEG